MRIFSSLAFALQATTSPKSAEIPSTPKAVTPSVTLEKLHSWADAHGAERRVDVRDEPGAGGGRGLVALERLEPGDVAVKIPLSMTLRVTPQDNNGSETNLEEDDGWARALAAKLCYEESLISSSEGKSSFFEPYINRGLPKEAPRVVCRWTPAERLQLQNVTMINESFENAAWRWRQLRKHRDSCDSVSNAAFLRNLDLVCSRTLKGTDGSRNLVPLIDNANHAPSEAGGGYFRLEEGAISLVVGRKGADVGEPVTLDYGSRPVDDFLMHYGFVPDRCMSDSVMVTLLDGSSTCLSWADCHSYRGHSDAEVREACAKELESFSSTLDEDKQLIVAAHSRGDEFMGVQYRIAKKSLLSALAGMAAPAFVG
mmetsp:Transcript_59533/g.176558  ORF Transcript_59533/g.176558 Transcript_59533/m.176558 type:complete len:370 (-) Transcript_59533:460-1569(-)|eukprot:CAMPEP_0113553570 /NCGR_PEP_ID=MMETSP0015_2-20120614/15684_1 /TAXON_ID=2838 /ORGANISM="Odontella" /LENGTH=369 /DNA_ID=CAMNT_0000454649 /DNA_START=268 /DNA_END=1377 /DNA_ORIENTATION=- /assembly_acc=CAM_ASM_000160